MPFGLQPRSPSSRAVTRVNTQSRHPDQVLAAIQQRQAVAPPGWHPRLLEQILERAPRAPWIGLKPLASVAHMQLDRPTLELCQRDARAAYTPEADFAAQSRQGNARLAGPVRWLERGPL